MPQKDQADKAFRASALDFSHRQEYGKLLAVALQATDFTSYADDLDFASIPVSLDEAVVLVALGLRHAGSSALLLLSTGPRYPQGLANKNGQVGRNLIFSAGGALKKKLKSNFTEARYLRFETFCDWLPNDNCYVSIDSGLKDRWGTPVARARVGYHNHDLKIGRFLVNKGRHVLNAMGADKVTWGLSGAPPLNLVAGGCRFGSDPKTSVLD